MLNKSRYETIVEEYIAYRAETVARIRENENIITLLNAEIGRGREEIDRLQGIIDNNFSKLAIIAK